MNVFSIEKGDPKFSVFARAVWRGAAFYRLDFKKNGNNRVLSQFGNIYSIVPLALLFIERYFFHDYFFSYIIYAGIFIFYASIFFDLLRGEIRWNAFEIVLAPHFFDVWQYIFLRRQKILWDEITEINITKPLQRISIYAGNRHIELNILEPFVSDEARRKAEFSLLAFARYARLKLRNKPGVIWST